MRKISETTKLGQTELLSQIIQAGLGSIAANQHTFKLPLTFHISSKPPTLKERDGTKS